jgi:hypothetical protein
MNPEQEYRDLMEAKVRISRCFAEDQAYSVRVKLLNAQVYLDQQASKIAKQIMAEEETVSA